VCPTAAPSQDHETSPTALNKTGAGDITYLTFCIQALNAAVAPICSYRNLHKMVTDFLSLLLCNKLACDDTLVISFLACLNISPLPSRLICLTKANLNIINCNIALDLNFFLALVTPCSRSSVKHDLNDNAGSSIDKMNDSNDVMHESANIFAMCCTEDGFHGGLVNSGAGLIAVPYNSEEGGEEEVVVENITLSEFLDIGSVVCVGGKKSCVVMKCVFRNACASSESLFEPGNGGKICRHMIDRIMMVMYFNISGKEVYHNSLDISYLPMFVGGGDNTSDLSTVQSHSIAYHHSSLSPSSEDCECMVHCTGVVKFVELNNSENPFSSRCVLETSYDGNKFLVMNNLPHIHLVCKLVGIKVTWISQLFATGHDIHNFSVAQEILINLKRNNVLPIAPSYKRETSVSCKHYDYEIDNICIVLAGVLYHNCTSLDEPRLRQNCHAVNCGEEAVSSQEHSRTVDLALTNACKYNYSKFNFCRHNVRDLVDIAEFKNKLLKDDFHSHIAALKVSHCASTSLVQLYPFCNCLLLHWMFSELLYGPVLNLSFRYHYRSYGLLYFVTHFKCWYFCISDSSIRKRLLCITCLARHHLHC
jgi:hypothetical protein